MRKGFQVIVSCLSLALAACGSADPADSTGLDVEDKQLVIAEAPVTGEASAAQATESVAEAATAVPKPVQASTGSGADDLTAYVGKFPFDKIGGVTWKDHPLVKAGIRKTVTDPAVRTAISTPGGPSAPIATYQGKVGSWGCEAHNCRDHQWAVLVDPTSGATDVCYHNAENTGENSRWFLADGREQTRSGNCTVV